MPTPTTRSTTWALSLLFSISLTCIFLRLVSRRIGIDPYDESIYLFLARFLRWNNFVVHQAWSPLYIAWYSGLAHLCPNSITRYFVSWSLFVAAITMLPSLFRVKNAWLYTCLLLSLPVLIVGPYLSLPAAALFVAGLCTLLRSQQPWPYASAGVLACAISWVVAFVRPEYVYGVYIAAAVTVVLLASELRHRQHKPLRHRQYKAAAFAKLLLVVCFALAMQFVSRRSAGDNRSGFAFVQHYNMRAIEDGRLAPQEGLGSKYTQRTFGLDLDRNPEQLNHTIGDFFRARPSLFLHHVLENALDRRTLLLVALLLIAVAWPWFRPSGSPSRPASIFLACISLPPIMGSLVLYPRDHYAMILIPSLTLLILQAIPTLQVWSTYSPLSRCATAAILLAILLGGTRLTAHRLLQPPFTWQRENQARVSCAQAVDDTFTDPRTIVFDSAVDLRIYVRHLREPVNQAALPDLLSFKAWVISQHPVWLGITPSLATQYGTSPDTIDHFLQTERAYVAHICPSQANLTVYTEPTQ